MPKAIVLVGIPCAGKSTWMRNYLNWHPNTVVLSIDNCVHFLAKQICTTYDEAFAQVIEPAERLMFNIMDMAAERGLDVIFDQTNLTRKSRQKKIKRLPKTYEHECVFFDVPLETALARRLNSDRDKIIPEDVIRRMHATLQIPTVEEGFTKIISA